MKKRICFLKKEQLSTKLLIISKYLQYEKNFKYLLEFFIIRNFLDNKLVDVFSFNRRLLKASP